MTSSNKGKCAICAHSERYRLEMLCAEKASLRAIAKKFGVNYHALWRHWRNHVDQERKAVLIAGPVPLAELAARAANENTSLLDHYVLVRNALERHFVACDVAGDRAQLGILTGRLLDCYRDMGKLTGELGRAGISITQNNFFVSPQWAEVQAALVQILARHPEARADVIRAFREIERNSLAAVRPAIEARAVRVNDAPAIAA